MGEKVISDIGKRLAQHSRPNKDFLVKSLRQAATALSELEQKPSLESAIKPLSDYVLKHNLLQHKDRDVRLLLAICFSEIIRILAPEPPFSDSDFREIFKLIISMFSELADTTSPYFSRRVKILETVAKLKCCLIMLDIGCEDLVLEMFNTFFSVAREHHQQSLVDAILSIMTLILNEKVSQPFLDVILRYLIKEGKGAPPASSRLAASIIQACSEKLEPFVCAFLTSCILDRDAVQSELKEFYHDIIYKIYPCAPQMLLGVIPTLSQELLADQVDVRKKSVNLIGRLFALPEHHVAQEYHRLFIEFLKRFSDKSAEVRVSALQCAKACYMANPSRTESDEVLSALYGRLLDFDDSVRTHAVIVACDISKSNLKFVPPKLISEATKRLRDKKISVRKKAFQKLLEVYRDYCTKCSEGYMTVTDQFEQIPCRIFMLCYDKDCKEFRPQNMELVLADDLFPVDLSVEERTRHWIYLFSLFDALHVKALKSILCQKQRFQTEFQNYLAVRSKEKESTSEEVQKRMKDSFTKMSASFPDPSKAEECFYKLNQVKDNSVFNSLMQLLNEVTVSNAHIIRDKVLKMIGDRHPQIDFLRLLSTKCLFNIFSSEHVSCILDYVSSNEIGTKGLQAASVDLLSAIISSFPILLKGSEEKFQMLLSEEDNPFTEKLIQVLAKAGPHVSIKLCDIYPFLKRICLEGTRAQSKFAVSAMASLTTLPKPFSELCGTLVDSLYRGQNIPTILQSLGCIAQHSVSTIEPWEREIAVFINERIFRVEASDGLASSDETSGPCNTCELKIYGLKTLVKRVLPHRGTQIRCQINELLELLSKMLHAGDIEDNIFSCENDNAYIRLAASKSVLKLSRRWDLHITPEVFRLTVLMAKDSLFSVRQLFLNKTHKLLKEHAIPRRYACAFALAAPDYLNELENDPCIYMAEFIKEYSREAQIRQISAIEGGSITDYPAYMVVFLIHILAHDPGFPAENCRDEELYARFCSPLFFVILALVNASTVDGDKDLVRDVVSYLLSILRAIRKAEDAVDIQRTSKLQILADIGISTVNAINHNGISPSRAHRLILLPSSLYKANSECPSQSPFDEIFVKKIILNFTSNVSLLISSDCSVSKHGRKCREDRSRSDVIKCSIMDLASGMQFDLSTGATKEDRSSYLCGKDGTHSFRQEIVSRGGRKQAVSPTVPGSAKLHNDYSTANGYKNGATKDTDQVLGKELSSSCDSVTTKLSQSKSQVSTQAIDVLSVDSLRESATTRNIVSITAGPSNLSRTQLKDHCSSKETNSKSEVLVGQRIKLLSPIDKCFHSGTVDGFDSENNFHKVAYDSGEVELLCLTSESWETIGEGSLPEKESVEADESNALHLRQRDPGEHSSLSSQKESVGLPNKEKRNLTNRQIPVPAKKKRQNVSIDIPASEIVDQNEDAIARRTRRRKL